MRPCPDNQKVSVLKNGMRGLHAAEDDPEFIEGTEGDEHEEHADGVGRGEDHGEEGDDEDGDAAFLDIVLGLEDGDAFEEEHDEGEFEAESEHHGHDEGEAEPFVESDLGIEFEPGGKIEEEIEDVGEDDEEAEDSSGEEESDGEGEVDVDVFFFVRVEPRGDEEPELVEDPGAGKDEAGDHGDLHVDHEAFFDGERDGLAEDPVGEGLIARDSGELIAREIDGEIARGRIGGREGDFGEDIVERAGEFDDVDRDFDSGIDRGAGGGVLDFLEDVGGESGAVAVMPPGAEDGILFLGLLDLFGGAVLLDDGVEGGAFDGGGDDAHDRLGAEEHQDHGNGEADEGHDEVVAEGFEMFPEAHGGIVEEVLIGHGMDSGGGVPRGAASHGVERLPRGIIAGS